MQINAKIINLLTTDITKIQNARIWIARSVLLCNKMKESDFTRLKDQTFVNYTNNLVLITL